MSDVKFPCEKCGECCRHISGIPELAEYDRGDGVCVHLKGVLCEIYDHRPDICNVETMFRKVFSKLMTREEFFAKNLDACKVLMKMNGKFFRSLNDRAFPLGPLKESLTHPSFFRGKPRRG